MSAAPSDESPVVRRRWKGGIVRRRSAALLVIGVGAFGMFDPPAGGEATSPEGTILIRRYFPPDASQGGTELGPATRITKVP
jgi:hypothetical protein